MTVGTLMTADELLQLPDDGSRFELIRGELKKMSPSGARHGRVAAQIIASVGHYAKAHRLGAVYAADAGFRIARNPDTVRAPDAAFVRADRVIDTPGFFEGPPDAVFEVVSPNDSYTEVDGKFVGSAPLSAYRLSAGDRAIEVRAPGHVSWKRTLTVAGGTVSRVAATLESIPQR